MELTKLRKMNLAVFGDPSVLSKEERQKRCIKMFGNVIMYVMVTSFFGFHLYNIINEYYTFKFLDIAYVRNLTDFLPDVALCRERNLHVYPMDLILLKLAQGGLTKFRKKSAVINITANDVVSSKSEVKSPFLRFLPQMDITKTEYETLLPVSQIIKKCRSMGHECSDEDFRAARLITSNSMICLIFRASDFYNKIKSKSNSLEVGQDEVLLDLIVNRNWFRETASNPSDPSLVRISSNKQTVELITLVDENTAFVPLSFKKHSALFVPQPIAQNKWNELLFSVKIRNENIQECKKRSNKIDVYEQFTRIKRTQNYDQLLCELLRRQVVNYETCDCIDRRLPIPQKWSLDEEKHFPPANFCHSVQPELRHAKVVRVDRISETVTLFSQDNSMVANFSFHDKIFTRGKCLKQRTKSSIPSSTECLQLCEKYESKTVSYEQSKLDEATIISEFFDDENQTVKDLTTKHKVIKVRPQSWKIEVINKEAVYPMSKLLSDLGGMIGLWLGLSVVSFVNGMLFVGRAVFLNKKQIHASESLNQKMHDESTNDDSNWQPSEKFGEHASRQV